MWIVFSMVSGILYTAQGLISRHVLKGNSDTWAFSFYFSAVGAAISLPFVIVNPKFPVLSTAWLLMLAVGILIVIQNLLNFKSAHTLEASLQGAITKFRLVFVFMFGILFVKEAVTVSKIAGTLATVLSGLIIIGAFRKPEKLRGAGSALLATIFYATVITLYKPLFTDFNSPTLTFFIFLIPALLNFFLMPDSVSRILKMFRTDGRAVLTACTFGACANLAMNEALAIGEATRTLVLIESFLIITLIGEHVILKEKSHLPLKLIAVTIAILGAILIRL